MSENLAVIFGGPSPEHDISILTGLQTSRVLSSKHKVLNIYWSQQKISSIIIQFLKRS
jgi:D-alanine-D-alanine ligase